MPFRVLHLRLHHSQNKRRKKSKLNSRSKAKQFQVHHVWNFKLLAFRRGTTRNCNRAREKLWKYSQSSPPSAIAQFSVESKSATTNIVKVNSSRCGLYIIDFLSRLKIQMNAGATAQVLTTKLNFTVNFPMRKESIKIKIEFTVFFLFSFSFSTPSRI